MENINKYNKEIVVWLRGGADSINTDEISKFHLKLTDKNKTEHIITFTKKDLQSIRHNKSGYLQLVFQKNNAIDESVYIESIEMCDDFSNIIKIMSINKLYIRIRHSWIRLVDEELAIERTINTDTSKVDNHDITIDIDEAIKQMTSVSDLLDGLVKVYNELEPPVDSSVIIFSINNFKNIFDKAITSVLKLKN